MNALQALGEALLNVAPARRAELDLPERLIDALDAAQRITGREARRRQLQFIGRLMRDLDAMGPFGMSNPRPVFHTSGVEIVGLSDEMARFMASTS